MVGYLLFLLFLLISAVYYTSKYKFGYWKKKRVPYTKPVPLFGNYKNYILLKEYLGHVTQKICQQFPDSPYIGTFYGTEPTLVIQNPDLIKLVLTKDFYYFSSREVSKYTDNEVFTKNLFFTYGDRWKVTRQNLTPLFSSAKMRNMFYLIENCAKVLEKVLDEEVGRTVEVRSLLTRYTMDCIGSCAFGVNTETMVKYTNNPFSTMGDLIFENTNYRGAKVIARAMWPAIFYTLRFKLFPSEIEKFFSNLLTGVFESRQYKPSARNDFVDLVLNLKKNNYIVGDSLSNLKSGAGRKIQLEIDNDLMVAQCIVFFAAGFETSATTLSFTLYEIAKNEEAQRRAHEEVDAYLRKHGNKVEYSCLTELPYVEACIDEALRLYPVLGVLTREVVEKYTFPSGLQVDKGVRIHIPVYHLQNNPDYFKEPEQYRPERFLQENKECVKPYTYMPFGEGPRVCIGESTKFINGSVKSWQIRLDHLSPGLQIYSTLADDFKRPREALKALKANSGFCMRFAKMQMLSGLMTILKKYELSLADDMSERVVFEPRALVTQPIGGIRLNFKLREDWEKRVFA